MKLSLYQRLSFSLIALFVVIALGFYVWSGKLQTQMRFEAQQRLHLSLAANLARDNPLLQQGEYDYQALQNLFHTLMVLGPAFEFYFVDPDGNILSHSADESRINRKSIDVVPINLLTHNQAALPIFGDDPRHPNRKKIFSAAPVFRGADLQGYLYVIVAGERYENILNQTHTSREMQVYLVFLGIALLMLLLLMLGLFRYFTYPMRRLAREMKSFRDSGFEQHKQSMYPWPEGDNNEVNQLGNLFNQMVAKIQRQFEAINENDKTRRELITHISHDLRTPIANMQGYLETLSLRDSLSEQQQKSFLNTALTNAQQLNCLVDQLFELAHLEAGQVSVNLEYFNLTELLYDVAEKFRLSAKKRDIEIFVAPEQGYFPVQCDIAKIERVLSNLIENALRHTANGGEIQLGIEEVDTQHLQLSVSDNGTGIRQEELSYIFDARYRASNASEDCKKHNGLGLTICKRLLEILKTDIRVSSELGQGTRFFFNLRRA
ncbi:ATP-binding protein [Thalassotalea litorea]|uniref:ATP-binding protein n=1 Tax=Thalassotalea litorea TaxID=2020715 RepID=UPI003736AB1E